MQSELFMSDQDIPKKTSEPEGSVWYDTHTPEIVRKILSSLQEDDSSVRPQFDAEAVEPPAPLSAPSPVSESATVPEPEAERAPIVASQSLAKQENQREMEASTEPPWTLQQFFNGEIDLDVELSKRFPTMPMLANIKFRTLGTRSGRRVATLTSQDASASLIIDADVSTKVIQMSFTLGSMLTLRFALDDLNDVDQTRWLELMRREQGGLAFLWGPERWSRDYLICIARRYHTNLYAFSPHHFEAAIRLTPEVTHALLNWLDEIWDEDETADSGPPELLTW